MTSTLWLVIAGLALVVVASRFLRGGLGRHVEGFLKDGDVAALVTHIETLAPDAQPTAYNSALLRIWGAYERRGAARLIREMGARVGEASIAQYWIQRTLEVEPEIAREVFDDEWLRSFYDPAVAQKCGSFG